jgi:hypothetical protein
MPTAYVSAYNIYTTLLPFFTLEPGNVLPHKAKVLPWQDVDILYVLYVATTAITLTPSS